MSSSTSASAGGGLFVDTNVLVYAHDLDAGRKHEQARALVQELWESREGVLSVQVLQELYSSVTRKLRTPVPLAAARKLVRLYSAWRVQALGPGDVVQASVLQEEHGIGFWDALIVVAAARAGAGTLLTEDLTAGQVLEGVRVENPFRG